MDGRSVAARRLRDFSQRSARLGPSHTLHHLRGRCSAVDVSAATPWELEGGGISSRAVHPRAGCGPLLQRQVSAEGETKLFVSDSSSPLSAVN